MRFIKQLSIIAVFTIASLSFWSISEARLSNGGNSGQATNFRAGNGSSSAPSFSFSSQTNAGMYLSGTNQISITPDGGVSALIIEPGIFGANLTAGILNLHRTGGNASLLLMYGGNDLYQLVLSGSDGSGSAQIQFADVTGSFDATIKRYDTRTLRLQDEYSEGAKFLTGNFLSSNGTTTSTFSSSTINFAATAANRSGLFNVDSSGNVSASGTLQINKGANATTTVNVGALGVSTSDSCFNVQNVAGSNISFYFVGTSMVIENNACR